MPDPHKSRGPSAADLKEARDAYLADREALRKRTGGIPDSSEPGLLCPAITQARENMLLDAFKLFGTWGIAARIARISTKDLAELRQLYPGLEDEACRIHGEAAMGVRAAIVEEAEGVANGTEKRARDCEVRVESMGESGVVTVSTKPRNAVLLKFLDGEYRRALSGGAHSAH